jgi:hypothetical protein
MTERAYIVATDIAKLRAAERILAEVTPMNTEKRVSPESHAHVMAIINSWIRDHEKAINVLGL